MATRNVETFMTAHRAFNARDFEAAANLMAEDVVYNDRARGTTFRGRAGFKDFMKSWVTAFSNAEVSEATYTDAGNTVVCQFVGRGTNDGPMGSLPPTGKPMTFNYCEILRFNDTGQAISIDAYYDQLSILTQLGHVKELQQAAVA
jgi:steroid delta-isomerase-like uncharacterized protein